MKEEPHRPLRHCWFSAKLEARKVKYGHSNIYYLIDGVVKRVSYVTGSPDRPAKRKDEVYLGQGTFHHWE